MSEFLASNKKAYFDYEVIDTLTAGIVLTGAEVKSIKNGGANLSGAYVSFRDDEAWLVGMSVLPYAYARREGQDPDRSRKLLLNEREISRLQGIVSQPGVTLVPLNVFLRNNLIKVLLGVCRGKRKWDKREALKKKSIEKRLRQVS